MIARLLFDTDENRLYAEESVVIEGIYGKRYEDITDKIVEIIKSKL